jgi:hypothetical protein
VPEKGDLVFGSSFGQFEQMRIGFFVLASFQRLFVVSVHFLSVLSDALFLGEELGVFGDGATQ